MSTNGKHVPLNGSKKRTGHTSCKGRGTYRVDEDGNVNFRSKPKSLYEYYGELCNCRGRLREEALSFLVEALSTRVERKFVEENFVTLFYQLLTIVKKGSAKEILLASHAIGLLAIVINSDEYAHEAYEESLTVLSQAVKPGSKASKIFECLGIVTFCGSGNSEETQTAMQIIWKFINPGSGFDDGPVGKKPIGNKLVLTTAITTWSFLLSTVDGWRLNHKYWKGAISYFSNLLEDADESVRMAAAEALALIVETDSLEKFSSEINSGTDSSNHGENNSFKSFKQELKENIIMKLRTSLTKVDLDGDEHSAETIRMSKCKLNILRHLQDGYCQETLKIGKDRLILSTLSQIIQLNFMKNFMGESVFIKHMMENEHLRNVFEVTPKAEPRPGVAHDAPIREEIIVRFVRREVVRQKDCSLLPFISSEQKQLMKKMTKSPNSSLSKARTILLNKNRSVSLQGKIIGDFTSEDA
ncbi:interferon-related developmental regulator 1-like isoform X2 [Tripterygium wilfordii]|uniref:interferon-related developmental regulator 1-like isoform X2 n=1 Tax=Tripterygium wilfordii TaxID=458696 RepID=UPI0018F8193B|nr:interferon-related developmental regulator 1-like isoform X2 [Tripterygium wilfordii]